MSGLIGAARTAFGLASGQGASGRLSILTYHRLHARPDPLFPGEMHAERFDRLCAALKRCAEVLPLDEAAQALKERRLPRRALCITFDDGYADNHDEALPILRAHGLCATFFITTGFIDGGCLWNDRVIEAIRSTPLQSLDLRDWGLPVYGLGDLSQRRLAVNQLLAQLKYLPLQERLARCTELAQRAQVKPPEDLMMGWDAVRKLADQGMQIGAHTIDHPILASLDDAAAIEQMAGSKRRLEQELGRTVRLFAYPNGRWQHDVDERIVRLLRPLGFLAAVTTEAGAARHDCDPLLLPRFTPWDEDPQRFIGRLAAHLLARRWRAQAD